MKEQKLNARQTQTALGRFVIFVQRVFVHMENEDLRVSHGYIVYVGHGLRLILTGLFLIALSIMLEKLHRFRKLQITVLPPHD